MNESPKGWKRMSSEEINWQKFCGLRAIVREATAQEQECDPAILQEWRDTRNTIVAKYYYLVERVAEAMAKKITEVEQDALASMGVDGLYDAVDGFEPELNIKFETYAVYRIRGSIIDAIRREDWVPRLVRSRAKKLERVHDRLRSELGRDPTAEEMAMSMGLSQPEYDELLRSAALRSIQSLNATFNGKDINGDGCDNDISVMDCVRDKSVPEPLDLMVQEELKSKLFGKGFTPQERAIINAYYFENRSMKQIADSLNLSESRVSQKNSEIIQRLREKIQRNPEYFGKQVVEALSSKK